MFVIGIGTGRCGTQTLATYLGLQKINTRHESLILDWDFNRNQADDFINHLSNAVTIDYPDVAEVNFSLLNYIEYFLERFDEELKIIVMKRNREDTIHSWMKNQPYMNMWSNASHHSFTQGDYLIHSELSRAFPKYDTDKISALNSFWENYYSQTDKLEEYYPQQVKTFDMYELFRDEMKQTELLDFLALPSARRFVRVLEKKIDEKAIVQSDSAIGNLLELYQKSKLDLRDFELKTQFSSELLLKFLLLGVALNIRLEKMPGLINEHMKACEHYFQDLSFLNDYEIFKEELKLMKAFLNEKKERYSYISSMSLRLREMTILQQSP